MASTDRTDRETTVVTTGNGGSGAGWFIAGILLVAVVLGAVFLMDWDGGGSAGGDSVNIEMSAPEGTANAVEGAANAVEGAANAVEDSASGN